MEQRFIEINNKMLPVIEMEGINYYPINFISEKILMKTGSATKLISKTYNLVKLQVSFVGGGTHMSNCIDENGLKQMIYNCNVGCMNESQLSVNNELRSELGMELLKSKFSNKPSQEELLKYSLWEQECVCIDGLLNPNVEWQNCSVCHKYYPMTDMFFGEDSKSPTNMRTYCKCCMGCEQFIHPDNELNLIYSKFGFDIYLAYRDHDVIKIYKNWIDTKYCISTPILIHNEEDYLLIAKYIYNKNKYTKKTVSFKQIDTKSKLTSFHQVVNQDMLFEYLFESEPYEQPWKYGGYISSDTSIAHNVNVLNDYISLNEIKITDVYTYDYTHLVKASKIIIDKSYDLIYLIMKLYNNKYASYRFDIRATNYWQNKDNRILALKYFIEEDMKLQIEKVPLYLTLTSLRNFAGTTTMYRVCKNYYKSLFEWVNEVYPDKFDPKDFDINYFRNDFDSVEESQVHDILTGNLSNVLYNPRNTDRTIKLGGKIPDWIVITDKNMYVIEYFGITNEAVVYNSRIEMYKKKMAAKLEAYKNITYCKYIFIYPYDMVDNFKGILEKINCIIVEQS